MRAAVIYRKLSLGSRSHRGERTIERLLSVRPDLPAATPLALRLPQRRAHRQNTRRSDPHPRLTGSRASTLAQAKVLIADGGTGVRDLVGVILRERCAVVSTLEQA
jgi:hypothetical protein